MLSLPEVLLELVSDPDAKIALEILLLLEWLLVTEAPADAKAVFVPLADIDLVSDNESDEV